MMVNKFIFKVSLGPKKSGMRMREIMYHIKMGFYIDEVVEWFHGNN